MSEPIAGNGIVLRPTCDEDLPTLRRFFTSPGFYEHWDGRPKGDAEIIEKYLGRRSPQVECFIVEERGRALGLVQYHVADDGGGGGMDLVLMAEERGRGIGAAVVRAIVEHVRTHLGWQRLTVDPDVGTERGVRFWTTVGFVPVNVVEDEEGRPAYVLMEWRGASDRS